MEEKKNVTLATEVVAEIQGRLSDVVMEIENLNFDHDKALFAVTEIMETVDVKPPKTKQDIYSLCKKMERIDFLAGITYDYISKIQSSISDIVTRERNRLVSG